MNLIEYIKTNFKDFFVDRHKQVLNIEEGGVQHPLYNGRPTHCRSFCYSLTLMLKPIRVLEIGSWRYEASNFVALAMDEVETNTVEGMICNTLGRVDSFDVCKGGYSASFDGYYPPKNVRVIPYWWLPHHTSFDTWKYSDASIVYPEFRDLDDNEIFEKNCKILDEIAPIKGYDIIIIDGDHSYEGVGWDWKYAQKYSHDGTIICIDDLYDSRHWQVRQFFDELTVPKYDFSDWNLEHPEYLNSVGVCLRE